MIAERVVGGQVVFSFEDDPKDKGYERRMSIRKWLTHKIC